jgi:hypothetical protein
MFAPTPASSGANSAALQCPRTTDEVYRFFNHIARGLSIPAYGKRFLSAPDPCLRSGDRRIHPL